MKTYEVAIRATITKVVRVKAQHKNLARLIACDTFDCQHSGENQDYLRDVLDINEVSEPAKFNHMLDVAFTVVSEHEEWGKIPTSELIAALRKRVDYLESNPQEAADAFGYSDTYKEE
jgi:hypothetical protein